MQIWASVNESDVEMIVPGSPVTFTRDGSPDKVFPGTVSSVHLNASMSQNVVLYTVIIDVDNSKGELLPYRTAKVEFEVGRDTNALIVPNLALRWVPASAQQIAPDAREAWQKTEGSAPLPAKPRAGAKVEHHGTVWVKDGQYVRPVDVRLGVTDREHTAVFSDDLKDGSEVITADLDPTAGDTEKNPFLPPMRRGH